MKPLEYHPLLHRFAVLTLIVALLPIVMGALVTTYNAGMAFLDWPSSDGYNMFFYPWLKSAGDKFIEHGHRLAGALIGLVSIGLAAVAWKTESRKSVRWAAAGVLLAVIVQGLLGGGRVRLDARTLAMVHGSFAALVFGLVAAVAVVTSRSWIAGEKTSAGAGPSRMLSVLTWIAPAVIFLQYLAGGFVRHFGLALHEHLGGAVLVTVFVMATVIVSLRSKLPALKRTGWLLFGFLVLQIGLGLGAWVMKFGFPPWGYVAVADSLPQVVLRTAHTVSGMLLFAAAVTLKLKTLHAGSVKSIGGKSQPMLTAVPEASLTWQGGL